MNYVIYHDYGNRPCYDGLTAAAVAAKKNAEEEWASCRFIPMSYGDNVPTDGFGPGSKPNVYMLDVSADFETMQALAEISNLHVLDHHETARDNLEGLEAEHVEFDLERSGAMLAWNFFFPDRKPPALVEYVQDRDLWTWEKYKSKEVNAYLRTLEPSPFAFAKLLEVDDIGPWVKKGEAILARQNMLVNEIALEAYTVEFDGVNVLCVNTPILQSEVVGKIAEGYPFAVGWHKQKDGYKVSLRKRDEERGPHLGRLAEKYGGGGHACAAGFRCDTLPWSQI